MILTYKDFPNLKFPLYLLPSDNWDSADKVLFVDGFAVDDKNMPGKTLGIRRIQCDRQDLLPLKKAVIDLPGLIQCKTKFFIDSAGKPWIYQKTLNCKLKTYKIKKIERKEVASLLWLHDVPSPITLQRPPLNNPPFVRMLQMNGSPWIVYDYVRRPVKDTYRRV